LILLMLTEAVPLKAVLPLCVFASEGTVSDDVMLTEEEVVLGAAQDLSAFPESYRTLLSKLQKSHPAWTYELYKVSESWDTAVESEMKNDRSWIEGSAPSEYVDKDKSRGGSWYLATKAGVEFYMDPRNYLDEKHIFAFEKQTYNSDYQTESAVQSLLKGTFMSGSIPGEDMNYAEAFCKAGALSAVNASPLFLAARVKQEQGSGNSDLISGRYSGYEGYYNYFNIQATGTGKQAVVNGLKYASTGSDYSRPWNTRYKSIKGGAEYIAGLYINKGQNNIYLQKFNVAYSPYYNHQYMQNIRAPMAESATLASSYSSAGILDSSFVFRIPVYKDMPGNPSSGEDDPEDPGDDQGDTNKKVDITLDKATLELKTGEIKRIGLLLSPVTAGLSLSSFEFKSSDEESVTVNKDGYVHAKKATDSPVTVTVSHGSGENASNVMLTVSVSDCVMEIFDVNGERQGSVPLSYNDTPYSYLDDLSSQSGNDVPAGYFTKASGKGFRVDEDYRIKGDIQVYPYYVPRQSLSKNGLVILPVGDRYYTGVVIKPALDVYCCGKHLTPGIDYKATFKKNKNTGLSEIVVKGKGDHKGMTAAASFKIYPAVFDMGYGHIFDRNGAFKDGKQVFAKPLVTYAGRTLKNGKDYGLTYMKRDISGAFQKKSLFYIKVKFTGNYEGEAFAYERIMDPPVEKVKPLSVKGSSVTGVADVKYDQKVCGGHYRPSKILVSDKNGARLTEGVDYTVQYKNDTGPGSASAVIRGIGAYTGSVTKKYKILP